MSAYFFNSLSNGEHSNLFTVATFPNIAFPGKMSLSDLYLPRFPDDKVEIVLSLNSI